MYQKSEFKKYDATIFFPMHTVKEIYGYFASMLTRKNEGTLNQLVHFNLEWPLLYNRLYQVTVFGWQISDKDLIKAKSIYESST